MTTPGFVHCKYVWENPTLGTEPFIAGLWCFAETTPNDPDLFELVAVIGGAYDHNLDALQAEQLNAGRVVCTWYGEDSVLEKETNLVAPVGGGNVRNPGFSLRANFTSERPPGGRQNGCYFPYIDTAWYGITGATQGGVEDLIVDWAFEIIDGLDGTVFQWESRHFVDNDDHDETQFAVTGATAMNSVSFLRRRYR